MKPNEGGLSPGENRMIASLKMCNEPFEEARAAFGQLFEEHRDYLFKIMNDEMRVRTQTQTGASDIVQDAATLAWPYMMRNPSRFLDIVVQQKFKAWLREVCLNGNKNQVRHNRTIKRGGQRKKITLDGIDVPAPGKTTSSALRHEELLAAQREIMKRLPESDRILLALKKSYEFTDEELVELIDAPSNDAKRMAMRRRLDKLLTSLTAAGLAQRIFDGE